MSNIPTTVPTPYTKAQDRLNVTSIPTTREIHYRLFLHQTVTEETARTAALTLAPLIRVSALILQRRFLAQPGFLTRDLPRPEAIKLFLLFRSKQLPVSLLASPHYIQDRLIRTLSGTRARHSAKQVHDSTELTQTIHKTSSLSTEQSKVQDKSSNISSRNQIADQVDHIPLVYRLSTETRSKAPYNKLFSPIDPDQADPGTQKNKPAQFWINSSAKPNKAVTQASPPNTIILVALFTIFVILTFFFLFGLVFELAGLAKANFVS